MQGQSLEEGRCGVAAVHEVLGSLALETPVNYHSELMEDSLWNIEPVQLGVEQCQASVELPSITDDTGCGVQQTLLPVSDGSWRPGQHGIATVNTRCDEGMHESLRRLSVK